MGTRMLNKAGARRVRYNGPRKQKAQLLIAIVLVASIAGTAVVLAQRKRTGTSDTRRPAPESQIVTPSGLSPSGPPVREYIYSGSRLIAIEEPGSAPTNNNDAAFVSQSVPTTMTVGQSYAVSITMRNTGSTTWTTADNYRLGSQNPPDNLTWGLSRVNLATSSVAPNSNATFSFSVTAPVTPGQHNFQWRMLKEGVASFGALTTNVVVNVTSGCTVAAALPPPSFPAETIWFDDQLPAGAQPSPATWPWDSSQKASGTRSHGEPPAAGFHQHFIANANPGVTLGPNDKIACYVLINSCAPPREIMLQYQDAAGGVTQWDHRAYWGEDLIFPTVPSGGAGKFLMGALPQAGVWIRLEVSASSVGMAGKTMSGIAFGVYDGQAWFDHVSIVGGCAVPVAGAPTLGPGDSIWVDDSLPAGAIPDGVWQWDSTQKAGGAQSHTEPPTSGLHQHYFYNVPGWTVSTGDKLVCYVLINPCNPPKEVMLQWLDDTNTWNHRAYWGQDLIPWGVPGTVSRFPMGALPQSSVWVRLEVPASQVGLEGRTVKGMAFTLYDGQAWFDLAGKNTGTTVPLITSLSPNIGTQGSTFPLTISGSNLSGTTAVNFSPSTGITVSGIGSTASQVTATVTINGSAATGQRNVSVTTSAGPSGTLPFTVQATNPVPVISSLSPNSAIAGGPGFTLTVNGPASPLTFVSNSVVRVNGTNRPTTFISGSQLQIAIAASEIASPGSLSIAVFNPTPGGGTSSTELLSITSPATGCTVSLLSGDGFYGYIEGASATAEWRAPAGAVVAKDPVSQSNALFVADTENNRIRMIYLEGASAGTSVLIAGNGVAGYGNGNGNALNARFNGPQEVAALTNASSVVTSLLVVDTGNQMIRRLTPPAGGSGSWSVTDVAGLLGIAGSDDGDSSTATFNFPRSLTAGTDGFIYVADSDNNAIRKVSLQGVVSTILFGVNLGITFPAGITSSKTSGLLYFSDQGGNSIWRTDTNGSNTLRVAGNNTAGSADGAGASARFNKPYHLAWTNSAAGEALYIADRNNNKLRKLVIATATVTTQAGSGAAGSTDGACSSAQFNSPRGVAVGPSGDVYVVDTANNRIRRVQ